MGEDQTRHEPKACPPLHARLFWYVLTSSELILLKAMVEHCWDGSCIWASIERLAAYSKLSVSQIQRLIGAGPNGDGFDKRGNAIMDGLVHRRILIPVAKASAAKRRPATYKLNEAALKEDPRMMEYRSQEMQESLPGIHLSAVPGQPVRPRQKSLPGVYGPPKPRQNKLPGMLALPDAANRSDGLAPLVAPCDQSGVTMRPAPLVSPCDQSGRTMRPDYLDSRRNESVEVFGVVPGSVIVENPERPTTPETVPSELATGLREILPEIDDAAIRQIFQACKVNADDCTVEEVLHFAQTKAPFLVKATNPTGFLIHAIPLCVTPSALLALRDRRQREEKQRREFEDQQVRDAARLSAEMAEYRRRQELEDMAKAEMDKWSEEKRLSLKEQVAQELFRKTPAARLWPNLKEYVRHLMVKHVAETLNQSAN